MENSRRGKVTHGCIVACIRLYLPDGSEAKTRPPMSLSPTPHSPLPPQCHSMSGGGGNQGTNQGAHHNQGHPPTLVTANELFQIKHYLVEALHREQMLETKLATLQNLVTTSMEESDKGWQALIQEDRLISRLAAMESHLNVQAKLWQTASGKEAAATLDDNAKQELASLHEDKISYEASAKESLALIVKEKLDSERRLAEAERALSNTEDECAHLQETLERIKEELSSMCEKHAKVAKEKSEMEKSSEEKEREVEEEKRRQQGQVTSLEGKIEQLTAKNGQLGAHVEELQAESEVKGTQIRALLSRVGADASFLDKIMILAEEKAAKPAAADPTLDSASNKDLTSGGENGVGNDALIIPKTTSASEATTTTTTTSTKAVDGAINELSSEKESIMAALMNNAPIAPEMLQPVLAQKSSLPNCDDPYLNEDDVASRNRNPTDLNGGVGGGGGGGGESKAAEDSNQRETPATDDQSKKDKSEWNIGRSLESTAYCADTSMAPITAIAVSSTTSLAPTAATASLTSKAPSTLVRGCLKAALDQAKSAVLKQENELVNQPGHILALIDRQVELFLSSHFKDDCQLEKSPDSEAERKLVDILLEESRRRQVEAEEELIVLRTILDKEKQRAQEQSEMIVEMKGRLPKNDSAYSSTTSLPCVIEGKRQTNNSNEVSSSSSKTVDKSGEQQMLETQLQKSKAAYDRLAKEYDVLQSRVNDGFLTSGTNGSGSGDVRQRVADASASSSSASANSSTATRAADVGVTRATCETSKDNTVDTSKTLDKIILDQSIPCGHCSCTNPDHEVEIRALRQQLSVLAEDSTALTLRARAISMAAILPLGLLVLAVFLAFYDFLASFTATSDGGNV